MISSINNIGDNIYCDYLGPKKVGINSVLLDRHNKHDVEEKITSLSELPNYLLNDISRREK